MTGKVNYVGGSLICRSGREMLRWSCAGHCLICHSAGWKLDMSVCRDMLRWKLYAGQGFIMSFWVEYDKQSGISKGKFDMSDR